MLPAPALYTTQQKSKPMLLTLKTLRKRLRRDELPEDYTLKTPSSLTRSLLISTLSLFNDNDQLIKFITKLSSQDQVTVTYDNGEVVLGGIERFIRVYTSESLFPELVDKTKQRVIVDYFQQQQFTPAQLQYLFKHLNRDYIRDLILSANCFARRDLVALCKQLVTIEQLDKNVLKLIYHYLNPNRRWGVSETPLLDMYYFAYRAGHILGVTENIRVVIGSSTKVISTSGDYNETSMKLLVEKLNAYRQSFPSPLFNSIYRIMHDCSQRLKLASHTYITDSDDYFYKKYLRDEIVYLSTGWVGHTVGVALYGRFLVYCNRGQHGDQVNGIKIYAINDIGKVDKTFFNKITKVNGNHPDFIKVLETVVDLNRPLARLKKKGQKRGDCSFSNPKAIIEALIILLQVKPDADIYELMAVIRKESNRKKYRAFSHFIRDKEIDELIKNMYYAEQNPLLVKYYAEMVKAFIKEHPGRSNTAGNSQSELFRACDFYFRCPQNIKALLKEDAVFMELIRHLKREKNRILLARGGDPIDTRAKLLSFRLTGAPHTVTVKRDTITHIDGSTVPRMRYSYSQAKKLCQKMK